MINSSETKPSRCQSCDGLLDAATDTMSKPRRPNPGDISVCLYCGHLQAFGDDLGLRDLTDAEILEVAADPHILRIQKVRGYVMERKRKIEGEPR